VSQFYFYFNILSANLPLVAFSEILLFNLVLFTPAALEGLDQFHVFIRKPFVELTVTQNKPTLYIVNVFHSV
jgi:hypothetical protein